MAGIGKSYVIKAIHDRMFEIVQQHQINPCEEPTILVLAPTGVAAFNINGSTIYSAFLLLMNLKNLELKPKSLNKFQQKFKSVKVIIFNKKSMIGYKLLA
ncbi:17483_t:CDS:1, partial [Cetraspora pellucida]